MPMSLHIVCFCSTATELTSYNRNHVALKAENIYSLTLCRRSLPTPCTKQKLAQSLSQAKHKQYVVYCIFLWLRIHVYLYVLFYVQYALFNKSIRRCIRVVSSEFRILIIKGMGQGRVQRELQVYLYCFISEAKQQALHYYLHFLKILKIFVINLKGL